MGVSIVLPAYNEEHRLRAAIETAVAFCEREYEQWELIVVDDGSMDRTAEVAAGFAQVRVLRNETNRGKGYSVKRGMLAARLENVLFSDVDFSTPITELLSLEAALESGADVAIATRRAGAGKVVSRTWGRRIQALVFRVLVRAVVLPGIEDSQCGFKLFRRAAAQRIFSLQRIDGWAFDVEILFLARRLGLRILQVPVEWHESADSRLKLASPVQMVRDLLRVRWLHRD